MAGHDSAMAASLEERDGGVIDSIMPSVEVDDEDTPTTIDLSAQHKKVTAADELRALAQWADDHDYAWDVYGKGEALNSFEAHVASTMEKEAARFFATGTSAQQAALKALTSGARPAVGAKPVICVHPTSHLVFLDCLRDAATQEKEFETCAKLTLPDFDVRTFGKMSEQPQLYQINNAIDEHKPDVIVIELPQRMNGGNVISLKHLQQVSERCRAEGILLHCDGARLWEVQPYYAIPIAELAALFDSVYISFYKGMGAIAGAMLIGSSSFISSACVWQKRTGGDIHKRGPMALSCEVQFRQLISSEIPFLDRFKKLKAMVKLINGLIDETTEEGEEAAVRFDPPMPTSTMVHCYVKGTAASLNNAQEAAKEKTGVQLWNSLRGQGYGDPGWCYFEWSMGPGNMDVALEDVERGWRQFLEGRKALVANLVERKQFLSPEQKPHRVVAKHAYNTDI